MSDPSQLRSRGIADDELFFNPSPSIAVPPLRFGGKKNDNETEPEPAQRPNRKPSEPPALPYPVGSASERMKKAAQASPYPDEAERPTQSPPTTQYPSSSAAGRKPSGSSSQAPGLPNFQSRAEGKKPSRTPTIPQALAVGPEPGTSYPPRKDSAPKKTTTPPQDGLNPYPEYHQQYWPVAEAKRKNTYDQSGRDGSAPIRFPPTQRPSTPPEDTATNASVATIIVPPTSGQERPTYAPPLPGNFEAPTPVSAAPTQIWPPEPFGRDSAPVNGANGTAAQAMVRPWTPTEQPGSHPYGPPTVWQGPGGHQADANQQSSAAAQSQQRPQQLPQQAYVAPPVVPGGAAPAPANALEQDFQRLNMTHSPPPSYSSLNAAQVANSQAIQQSMTPQGFTNEKVGLGAVAGAAAGVAGLGPHPSEQYAQQGGTHPAVQQPGFAINQYPGQDGQNVSIMAAPQPGPPAGHIAHQEVAYNPPPTAGPASPPPLPEGWMAHFDPNQGAYYYIHILTQRTQWEFPTPENMFPPPTPGFPQSALPGGMTPAATPMPMSPMPLGSPFKPPMTPGVGTPGFPAPGYAESVATASLPLATPPPSQLIGVERYKIAPTNGAYFGPYVRYTNMDLDHGIWLGSVMLVTEHAQPPTIHLHQSQDLSPNPRQLKANAIYTHRTWTFYRYDLDIQMGDFGTKWTYAVTSHLGCTRYEFLVAGRWERNWRFIAHSCNDFSVAVTQAERAKWGGVGFMWQDVMVKHMETGGFHAQLGGGDQIYADRIWKEVPCLKEWLDIKGKENRKNAQWTPKHEEDVQHAYFHYYSSHLDQPHVREAWAQIPHILQIDDHDIFDGFGSYPEYMQNSHMFKNIGRIAIDFYLLFQHHTTLNILRAVQDERDLFTISGTGWHFVKYLGPGVAVVGPDTRSERNAHQVLAAPTYQGIFPRIANVPTSVQHIILMLAVPIIYPRLEVAEQVVNSVASTKRAVNGTFNVFSKVVGGAAGVVGAKGAVTEGLGSVKKAFGKSGLMSSVVSVFGEVDLLDDLRDHWTHDSKDLERTYFIRTLQGIAKQRAIRMTFLSGDVHCCGAGLVHDPSRPADHKTMYQIISSAIVNVPPPNMVIKMLHNNKPLYVPQNGIKSNNAISDTKEDMIELFQTSPSGTPLELKKLMPRRNYAIFQAYDAQQNVYEASNPKPTGPLSIAVDLIVQGEGIYATTVKYGPVVVPRVEFGY